VPGVASVGKVVLAEQVLLAEQVHPDDDDDDADIGEARASSNNCHLHKASSLDTTWWRQAAAPSPKHLHPASRLH